MRADTVWEPGDKSDDWHVMNVTCARPIASAIFSSAAKKKKKKKQKNKMRQEMKAGREFGGSGETLRESKETKVNRTVPARRRFP